VQAWRENGREVDEEDKMTETMEIFSKNGKNRLKAETVAYILIKSELDFR